MIYRRRCGPRSPRPSSPTRRWLRPEGRSGGKRVGGRHPSQPGGARLGRPSEGLAIHADEAKAGFVAEGPLEVVQKGPVRIATHVHALRNRLDDAFEGQAHIVDSLFVVCGADAVLRHDEGYGTSGVGPGTAETVAQRS